MKRKEYKPRYAYCVSSELDNPVEVGQSMTVQEMLFAYTRGMDLPDKFGTYDEGITIDEVGYTCPDRLEAVDYLNSVNQRIALQKMNSSSVSVETEGSVIEEVPVSNE